MKFKSIILSALAAVTLIGCQKEAGNTPGEGVKSNGRPLVLDLGFASSQAKTKANNTAGRNNEALMNNATVYVLKANGEYDVNPLYTAFAAGGTIVDQTISMEITENASEVYVLVNGGDPATSGTIANDLAVAISGKGTESVKSIFQSFSIDLLNGGSPTQTATPGTPGSSTLTQTGFTSSITMDFTDGTAEAVVNLGFVASRVSFKGVQFFCSDFATQVQTQDEIDAQAASGFDMTNTKVTEVFILNAPATTHLFPHAETTAENGKTWSSALFTKTDAFYQGIDNAGDNTSAYQYANMTDGTDGTADYFPTMSGYNASYISSLKEAAASGVVANQYFYVWENRDNGLKDSGITLAVIAAEVHYTAGYRATHPNLPADGTIQYYPVVLNNGVNNGSSGTTDGTGVNGSGVNPPNAAGSKFANYSTKRGVQYLIYANITGAGVLNPFQPRRDLALGLTIEQSTWDVFDPVTL